MTHYDILKKRLLSILSTERRDSSISDGELATGILVALEISPVSCTESQLAILCPEEQTDEEVIAEAYRDVEPLK